MISDWIMAHEVATMEHASDGSDPQSRTCRASGADVPMFPKVLGTQFHRFHGMVQKRHEKTAWICLDLFNIAIAICVSCLDKFGL
jgi:hypothetical protein